MATMRKCWRCGASSAVTYISKSLMCRACARVMATNQVDRAYDLAEGLGPRTDDSLATGIARSNQYMTWAAQAARFERAAKTAAKKAARTRSA